MGGLGQAYRNFLSLVRATPSCSASPLLGVPVPRAGRAMDFRGRHPPPEGLPAHLLNLGSTVLLPWADPPKTCPLKGLWDTVPGFLHPPVPGEHKSSLCLPGELCQTFRWLPKPWQWGILCTSRCGGCFSVDSGKIFPAQPCHVSGRRMSCQGLPGVGLPVWGCINRLGLAVDGFQHGITALGKGSPVPGAQHSPCPGADEQLARQQMPKWNRSPPLQSGFPQSRIHIPVALTAPQHVAHAARDAPPISQALVLLPASRCRPGSLLPSASSSSSRFPGLEGELSWGCLCQRQAQGNGNGWCCSQPGCLPGKLWLYLLSQAPWEQYQGLPGAGEGAGAAPDPWARSRGVVFLPSSTAALTQEGICNAEKNLPPATRQRVGRERSWERSWEQLCSHCLGSTLLPLPRGTSWAIPGSGTLTLQVGLWGPSGHHALRTELCPGTVEVMLCSPLVWGFCLLPTLDSLSPLSRDRLAGTAGMAGITVSLSWSPRHGEHYGEVVQVKDRESLGSVIRWVGVGQGEGPRGVAGQSHIQRQDVAPGPLRSCWEGEGGWWRLVLEGQCVSGPDWTRNSAQDWQEFPQAGWKGAPSLHLEASAGHILSW